jgi:GPH family glycoside/pentoside/hexuronide:cation symporter
MYLLLGLYVMKFSTDVLLIAPGVMGLIFGLSRLWDAVSDPLVGYLSDKTSHRFGRRRTWILGSIVPIILAFLMVFAPPAGLSGTALTIWMAVGIVGYYSAMTIFFVPHLSLGAELTKDYHERSRLFGVRHAAYTFGSILSLASMYILISAEAQGSEVVRATAFQLALVASGVMTVLILVSLPALGEPAHGQAPMQSRPYAAFKDVWNNHHARLLIGVTFVEHLGSAAIGVLTLYVAQYVVGAAYLAPLMVLAYMVPSSLSVPIWLPLSRRFGKRRLWIISLLLSGVSFGGMFVLPFLDTLAGRLWLIFILAAMAGFAAGAGGTISPSIQGDVIDFDELQTGERKEGSYFAAWNFVYKCALGAMLMLTGVALSIAGFVPNAEQTMTVQLTMVGLYGLLPLACYLLAALMFRRFSLNEAECADIRRQLDERHQTSQATQATGVQSA